MNEIDWPDVPDQLEPAADALLPAEDELPEDYRAGFVAVVGKPNVGKSTLMNRYVGQKVAIVSPKPQTTRRRILGIRTDNRAQIVFVDTPGIHQPLHKLGEVMVETARRAVPDADIVLFLVDASERPADQDEQIAALLRDHASAPIILVLNKIDRIEGDSVSAPTEAYSGLVEAADTVSISATEGTATEKLLATIIDYLPAGPQYYPPDQVTDQPERLIGAELIREQVLRFTREEVPHAVEVVVEEWKQRRENLTYVSANVFVEKESQKGIVIGSGGSMLKRIGQAARQELERFVGHQVYLELWVKVRKQWRKDPNALRWFGHTVPKD
jgi:GTP-binding protein Era